MDKFKITDFLSVDNPDPQSSGVGSSITEYNNRVEVTIGSAPVSGSTYAREKYRLATEYKSGDDFWVWEIFELPSNYYTNQNASMRLIALWHNVNRGRLGLWIDSSQAPRLQIEDKAGTLRILWRGQPKQFPVGKHQIALHIILGTSGLIELFVDGVSMGKFVGNVLPYAGYTANQVLYFFDGANGNTHTISATGWEIGADTVSPLVSPCSALEVAYQIAVQNSKNAEATVSTYQSMLNGANIDLANALAKEKSALDALTACQALQ